MNTLAALIFSALAGSFFNMLIYRLNNGVSLFNPAHSICPRCRERLHWFELLPVLSFLCLRGRCASCGEKIPRRYLYVELAFILTAAALACGLPENSIWPSVFLSLFGWAVFFSDLEYREIPYTFSLGFLLLLGLRGLQGSPVNLLIWLGLLLFIKAAEYFHYRRPVLGGTDFLLFLGLAFYFPLANYVLLLYLTFFSGLCAALCLLILRRAGRDTLIPFTPFILLAFVLVELGGDRLLRLAGSWYA